MGKNIFMTILGFLSARIYERFVVFDQGGYRGYQKQLVHDISVTANYNVNVVRIWKEIVGTISFSQTYFISTKDLKRNLFNIYFDNKIENSDQFFLSLGKIIYQNQNFYKEIKLFVPDNEESLKTIIQTMKKEISALSFYEKDLSSSFFEEISYALPERKANYDIPPKIFGEAYYP